MAAGYLVSGRCVEVAGAYDVYYSSVSPELTAGSTSYLVFYTKNNGVWSIRMESISQEGVVTHHYTVPATKPVLPSCNTTEEFFDGMTMAWGIVIAMVVAWGIKQLGRAAS